MPAQAATRSEAQASAARTANRPTSQALGRPTGIPLTTATTTAVRANAVAMVATPQHPQQGQERDGPARGRGRAQETGVERSHQWEAATGSEAAGMCWVPIRLRNTQ